MSCCLNFWIYPNDRDSPYEILGEILRSKVFKVLRDELNKLPRVALALKHHHTGLSVKRVPGCLDEDKMIVIVKIPTIACHTRKPTPHRKHDSKQMDLCDPGRFVLL